VHTLTNLLFCGLQKLLIELGACGCNNVGDLKTEK